MLVYRNLCNRVEAQICLVGIVIFFTNVVLMAHLYHPDSLGRTGERMRMPEEAKYLFAKEEAAEFQPGQMFFFEFKKNKRNRYRLRNFSCFFYQVHFLFFQK